jgi:hypothetical protein
MKRAFTTVFIGVVVFGTSCAHPEPAEPPGLVGAWRSKVLFRSGAFEPVKDLEFMYVFNAGGTLTESSNYDGAPPVPPAYGTWRDLGRRSFEARYEFFSTKAPSTFDEIAGGAGWTPAGHGVLTERITLSEDGRSFTSTLRYEAFDTSGKPAEGGGDAAGRAQRIGF